MSFNDGFSIKGIPFVSPIPNTASLLISNPEGTGWIAGDLVDNVASASINIISTVETSGNIEGNGSSVDKVRLKNNISLNSVTSSFKGNLDGTSSFSINSETASYVPTGSAIPTFTSDVRAQLSGSQYVTYGAVSGVISLPFTGSTLGTTPVILGTTVINISGLTSIESTSITASSVTASNLLSTRAELNSLTASFVTSSHILATKEQLNELTASFITSSQILATKSQFNNLTASFITSSQILATNEQLTYLTASFITGTQLTIDYTDYNTLAPVPAFKTGRLHYNPDTADLEYDTDISNVTVQYGQQTVIKVKNENIQTINKGKLVRIVGGSGANPLIRTASWENDANSANTLGMVMQTVSPNAFTYVLLNGVIKDISLPTTTYAAGDILYLSSSGDYTNVKPAAPIHTVRVGEVVRAQTSTGVAFIKIDNGYELDELHDVVAKTASLGDLIAYDESNMVWRSTKTLSGSYVVTGTLSASNITVNSLTGSKMFFSASNPSNWTSPAPTTIADAINRIAAAVSGILTGTIP